MDFSLHDILTKQKKEDDLRKIEMTLNQYKKRIIRDIYIDNKNHRRLIFPKDNQQKMSEACHHTPFGGHQGINPTKEVINMPNIMRRKQLPMTKLHYL